MKGINMELRSFYETAQNALDEKSLSKIISPEFIKEKIIDKYLLPYNWFTHFDWGMVATHIVVLRHKVTREVVGRIIRLSDNDFLIYYDALNVSGYLIYRSLVTRNDLDQAVHCLYETAMKCQLKYMFSFVPELFNYELKFLGYCTRPNCNDGIEITDKVTNKKIVHVLRHDQGLKAYHPNGKLWASYCPDSDEYKALSSLFNRLEESKKPAKTTYAFNYRYCDNNLMLLTSTSDNKVIFQIVFDSDRETYKVYYRNNSDVVDERYFVFSIVAGGDCFALLERLTAYAGTETWKRETTDFLGHQFMTYLYKLKEAAAGVETSSTSTPAAGVETSSTSMPDVFKYRDIGEHIIVLTNEYDDKIIFQIVFDPAANIYKIYYGNDSCDIDERYFVFSISEVKEGFNLIKWLFDCGYTERRREIANLLGHKFMKILNNLKFSAAGVEKRSIAVTGRYRHVYCAWCEFKDNRFELRDASSGEKYGSIQRLKDSEGEPEYVAQTRRTVHRLNDLDVCKKEIEKDTIEWINQRRQRIFEGNPTEVTLVLAGG
jgi:hypothetical protein